MIATVVAVISAVVFPWPAGADHQAGHVTADDPFWTCSASAARLTLGDGEQIPPIEPLAANTEREECAEDLGGLPTIALPPPPDASPLVTTQTAQARTQIFCADGEIDPENPPEDDPATPQVDETELCDAGVPTYQQRVLSTADVTDTEIRLGEGATAFTIRVRAANTSAQARCGPGNVPVLASTSEVLGITVGSGPTATPIELPIITGEPNQVLLDLPLLKLTVNELVGQEGAYPETNDPAAEGSVTRRAVHAEVPGGTEPDLGSVADVVVSESVADFHGDVCPEGRVVVKKETAPDEDPNTTPFNFTAVGNHPLEPTSSSFTLMDDGEKALEGSSGSISDEEVLPGQYTVTESTPTNGYILTGINCVENRTGNTTTTLPDRRADIDVGPGETVTCTFINAKQPTCPDGTPPVNGTCPTAVTCPGGITPVNGTCPGTVVCPGGVAPVNGTCPGAITCPGGVTPVNGACPGTVTCPGGVAPVNGTCPGPAGQATCPPGSTRNAAGQCIVTDVQCPAGTTFNPVTRGCTEAPRGGVLVPLNIPALQNLFRASPCIGQGFGPLLGIIGTNGPDRITGTNMSDRIFALAGNDRVSGGRGDDCVEGGAGNDVLDGSNGNDFLLGGTGNDRVVGGPGRDRFSGGSGRDVMSGGIGNDRMNGSTGPDRLQGGYGNDRLVGGSGNDGIHTGNGRDRVSAGSGNDVINAATRGPAASVNCGPGSKDRVRINRNETRRIRNCEFVDVPRRIRSQNRPHRAR